MVVDRLVVIRGLPHAAQHFVRVVGHMLHFVVAWGRWTQPRSWQLQDGGCELNLNLAYPEGPGPGPPDLDTGQTAVCTRQRTGTGTLSTLQRVCTATLNPEN